MESSPSLLDQYLTALHGVSPAWEVVVRDDARVLARLRQGQCEGLLPDFWREPDDLLHFALDLGAVEVFASLPDPRQRRTIPAALFGKVLLAGTLPDRASLRQIGATVFNSAALLDQLGVNYVNTRTGGSRTGDERPFDVEALGDYLALLQPDDYTAHALTLARWLRAQHGLQGTTWALDCVDVRIPRGRVPRGQTAETVHLKVAVLSVLTPDGALPLLWRFGTPQDGDIELARLLWADAVALCGPGSCEKLLVDAGFIDGQWVASLQAQGTTVFLRLRETMDPCVAAAARSDNVWQTVALPKRPSTAIHPIRREIAGCTDWPGWEQFGQDLALCLVRDTYADGHIDLWFIMSSDPALPARTIYDTFRQRWQLEETYMALTRYHHLNALPASRVGVACARVNALLFAYTLRAFCRQQMRRQQQTAGGQPWRRHSERFIVYAGGAFAVLKPSQLLELVVRHAPAWAHRLEIILQAVRFCEGSD
jgi:hypothetical protein